MLEHCALSGGGGQLMLNYYDPKVAIVRSNHYLILGSPGCGKTALGLSLGNKNFLIFLEMPTGKSGGGDPVWGFQTLAKDWCKSFQSEDEVHAVLYADIVSRLVVLKHVLKHIPDLTPTQWLLYCFSKEGSDTVRLVHSQLWAGATLLSSAFLAMIDGLEIELRRLRGHMGLPLILMVDELQELGNRQAMAGKSVIDAVVSAATGLPFPAVWIGTRVDVTAGKSNSPGIAKVYRGRVNSRVVCDFEYLSIGSVRQKLLGMLDLSSVSEDVQRRLGYLLQGRARMVATFVEVLLNHQRYGGSWPEALTDKLLLDAAEDLLENFVVARYESELGRMCGDTGYGRGEVEVGRVWAFNMLPPPAHFSLDAAAFDRQNSLSFTRSVKEVKVGSEGCCKTEHHFTYQFGEPGLQEALLRYVKRPGVDRSVIAMAGIEAYLLSQDSAGGLGACCNRALALSFLVHRENILRTMLSGHPGLHIYQDYEFTVKRVVEVSAEQQLEWFRLVNSDPMAISFSLMPGIPVRDILILPSTFSGADVIGVATPPEAGLTAEAGNQGKREDGAFSYATGSRAKKARIEPGPARVPLLIVQVCSALYWSKMPTAKVEDQITKCAEQFATQGGGAAAKEYAKLERELLGSGQIAHLSILSELPTSSFTYSEEEKLKYVRIGSEEIVDWGLFSADLMNQIKQMKGH